MWKNIEGDFLLFLTAQHHKNDSLRDKMIQDILNAHGRKIKLMTRKRKSAQQCEPKPADLPQLDDDSQSEWNFDGKKHLFRKANEFTISRSFSFSDFNLFDYLPTEAELKKIGEAVTFDTFEIPLEDSSSR